MLVAVKLTKNADIDKHKYLGYGIGFDTCGTFSFPTGRFGQNIKNFGADMSFSVHTDIKNNNILVSDEGSTQGLHGTTWLQKKGVQLTLLQVERSFI